MQDSVKILNISSTLERGGIEAVMLNYFDFMDRSKIEIDFLAVYGDKLYYKTYLEQQGAKVYSLKTLPRNILKHIKEVKQFFKTNLYDIVHIHTMTSLRWIYAKLAKKSGVKKVIYHSHNSNNEVNLLMHKLCRGKLNKWCDYKFACSENAGKYMFNKDFQIIPNAINIKKFTYNVSFRQLIREQLNVKPHEVLVGNIARMTQVKNQQFLIKVIKTALSQDKNMKLLLIGEGLEKENLMAAVKSSGVEEHVMILAPRDDIYKYYSAIDIFALPSLFEGLAVVTVEAQTAGCKCLLADTVSKETVLTNNVSFLPIAESEENYQLWVDNIAKNQLPNREEFDTGVITQNGYDIALEAKKMQEFYISIADKK